MVSKSDQQSPITKDGLSLIQAHFARIAKRLQAEGAAARSFDHGTNRGQIREAFIREFLRHNTSPLTGIGTGEIVHADSKSEDQRNQVDVVIHNNRYPKISLAAGIDLFFAETVSSFIEVKSYLKKDHLRKAAQTAKRIKQVVRVKHQNFNPRGMVGNPRPYSFVFSYDGPSRIETVLGWMKEIADEDDYGIRELRNTPAERRNYFNHFFIDGIFVLGRGYVCLDVLPFESVLQSTVQTGDTVSTEYIWIYEKENELPLLWILINELSERYLWNNISLVEYLGVFNRRISA